MMLVLFALIQKRENHYIFLDNSVKFINLAFLGEEYINIKYYLKKLGKELLRIFCDNKMMFLGRKLTDPKKEYFISEFIKRLKIQIESYRARCYNLC